MRRCGSSHALFNIQIMSRMILSRYKYRGPANFLSGHQVMINSKNVVASLRRDATFVWHAVIAVVFIGFASLAVAAAFLDVIGIRH